MPVTQTTNKYSFCQSHNIHIPTFIKSQTHTNSQIFQFSVVRVGIMSKKIVKKFKTFFWKKYFIWNVSILYRLQTVIIMNHPHSMPNEDWIYINDRLKILQQKPTTWNNIVCVRNKKKQKHTFVVVVVVCLYFCSRIQQFKVLLFKPNIHPGSQTAPRCQMFSVCGAKNSHGKWKQTNVYPTDTYYYYNS